MTDLQRALAAFWSRFAPAYVSGCVPEGAELPYIVFDAARPDALGQTLLAATLWCRGDARRAEILTRIAGAIPPGGVRLPLGGGFAILERNGDFQSLRADPQNPAILGGRTACALRYYNIEEE